MSSLVIIYFSTSEVVYESTLLTKFIILYYLKDLRVVWMNCKVEVTNLHTILIVELKSNFENNTDRKTCKTKQY